MVRPVKKMVDLEYHFYICFTLDIALYNSDTGWFEKLRDTGEACCSKRSKVGLSLISKWVLKLCTQFRKTQFSFITRYA